MTIISQAEACAAAPSDGHSRHLFPLLCHLCFAGLCRHLCPELLQAHAASPPRIHLPLALAPSGGFGGGGWPLSCTSLWALPAGSMDGILRTFDLFMAYSPGYFVVDIVARDLAGHNDTAVIGIYILRDDQRVKIVINEIPDRVRDFEEEFIRLLSNITGAIVNTDDVQVPHGSQLGLGAVEGEGGPGHKEGQDIVETSGA